MWLNVLNSDIGPNSIIIQADKIIRLLLITFCRRKVVLTDASNLGWGRCAMANRPSTSGRRRKVTFTSTAWKCWQYVWTSHLFARPEGTSRLSPLGQYDCGVLHKSPGRSFLEALLYSSGAPFEVGSAQLALAENNACAGQTEPGSRHAISEKCPLRQVDAPPTNGS